MNGNDAIKKAIEVFEKPSKHIKCVHKCENGMEFLTYSQDLVAAFETAIDGLKELEEYRKMGTVEQFHESKEMRTPKKPIKYGANRHGLDNDGNSINKQEDCYECPTCESFLGYVRDCRDENYQDDYCRNCGQALDWS